jgi:hypothetical protein
MGQLADIAGDAAGQTMHFADGAVIKGQLFAAGNRAWPTPSRRARDIEHW